MTTYGTFQKNIRNLRKQKSPYGSANQLLVRGKIRLLKVEHPNFKGHVTSNEDKYNKICPVLQLKLRYCFGVS